MHICRIHIENFRNFKNVTFETGQNIVLVGANATGKSNLIHALRLVLDSTLSHRDRLLTSDDFWREEGLLPWDGRAIHIWIELTGFSSEPNLRCLLDSYCLNSAPGVARLNYLYRYFPKDISPNSLSKEEDYNYIRFGKDNPDDSNFDLSNSDLLKYIGLRVISALRDAEKELVARSFLVNDLFRLFGITGSTIQEVLEYVEKANEELKKVKQIIDLETAIQDRLKDMLEHIHDLDPRLRLLESNPEKLIRAVRLRIEGDRLINSTSLGLANVLFLTLYILAVEKREDPSTPPTRSDEWYFTILAIEEPEAHLHPHLQRIIFRDFSKRNPLILSTHSPHIASISGLDSIIMLRKLDGLNATQVKPTAKLTTILSREQIQDLDRYLDITRAELLFARAVIFVEGDSEEFLIPIFAQKLGYNLDQYGITVCNIRGTDFVPYVTLIGANGLDIPYIVFTDGDKYAKLKKDGFSVLKDSPSLSDDEKETLRKFDEFELRKKLDELKIPYYFGLKRCLDLLPALAIDKVTKDDIAYSYNALDWTTVQKKLEKLGLFVNLWSLEPSLIESGYAATIIDILDKFDLGPRIKKRLEAKLVNDYSDERDVKYLVDKISDAGKGRVAQRLSAKLLDSEDESLLIPDYIKNGVTALISKLTIINNAAQAPNTQELMGLEESAEESEILLIT